MHGATPTGRHGRSYSYYMSLRKIKGVRYIIPTEDIEQQLPGILHGIHIHPEALPQIRALYKEQIARLEGPTVAERIAELKGRIERLHVEEAALVRLYTQGKVSDKNYDGLYREWQLKVLDIKQEIHRLEDTTEQITADLDRALALLACTPRLFERLPPRHQWRLLQIIFGRIIIDTQGKIVELEFNSPFVYLMSLWDAMDTRSPREGDNQAEVSGVLSLHPLPSPEYKTP